ncbi:MAG: RelA/SpoT family protein, partial [Aggregatilineales bacterium]
MVAIKAYPRDLQTLLERAPHLHSGEISLIERAYHKAEIAHEGQMRKSGDPYFTHCLAVAGILADIQMDGETIAAGLLHDVVEDTGITCADLRPEFGEAVTKMVDGVTKLTKLKPATGQESDTNRRSSVVDKENEYFRKMFLSMGNDVRVVIVKLADRLHNMRTLGHMPEKKQVRISQETSDIFAPLAGRLGIWQFKWELEDLSFRYLQPDIYRTIAGRLDERREDREDYVKDVAEILRENLALHGIHDVKISARPKHIYSIYSKMERKKVPLEQIYDQRAVRLIVNDLVECYAALGIVHSLWRPVPGEFDDYIASPKNNLYRSLHTAVIDTNGKTLEVQIRTGDMHEDAEYGVAAHWRYKEGSNRGDEAFNQHIEALRRSIEAADDSANETAASFLNRMKSEVFQDRIYVFTPRGDIIDLPSRATPVDFAYHIHTEIGHRCRGAKVHGKLVSLNYQLSTGDQVEITTAKRGGPSLDWLNEALGYVNTARAQSKIRHYFRKQNREKNLITGRTVLERELKRLGMMDNNAAEMTMQLFEGYNKLESFLIAIGKGDLTGTQITDRI